MRMVKFAKQLEGSLVPEWKDAYCNYKELKRDVNRIKEDRQLHIHGAGIVVPLRGSMSQLHSLGSHLKRTAHGLNPLSRDHDQVPLASSYGQIRENGVFQSSQNFNISLNFTIMMILCAVCSTYTCSYFHCSPRRSELVVNLV